jgi:hypothetical protein
MIVARAEYDKQYVLTMDKLLPVAVVPHPAGLDISTLNTRWSTTFSCFFQQKVNVTAALIYRKFSLIRAHPRCPADRGLWPHQSLTELAKDPCCAWFCQ